MTLLPVGRAARTQDARPADARGRRRPDLVPVLVDVAVPLLLSLAAAHELLYNDAAVRSWALALVVIWPLALRRRAPLVVLGVCLVAALLLWVSHVPSVAGLSVLVALYTVAAHRGFRTATAATLAVEGGVVLAGPRFAPIGSVGDVVILLSGSVAAALFLGTTVRVNRRYLASVEDRARRLEQEQAQRAQLAAAAERTRIAREMHDVVAHGLSVVITLAEGAAASAADDPAASRSAMQQVAGAGRQSMAEMRRLLDVLRADSGSDRAPQPDLTGLEDLVAAVRRTGLTVRLDEHGDRDRLAATVQATLYRIVQEALTNVLKHARAASVVSVALVYGPAEVRFCVADDGCPAGGPGSGGVGLIGMAERVAMFGGRLEAGSTATGWSVRGELPVG